MYFGDFNSGETITHKFTTVNGAGQPTALISGAISIYKDGSATQTTTGVTLTPDFDAVTGLNHVAIVTTDAFYEAGSDYTVVLTSGTVGGTSVVGYRVGQFSIANRQSSSASLSAAGFTIVAGSSGLLTYADAIDYLVDFLSGAPEDKEQRFIRAAIQSAYREVTHQPIGWKYYTRKTRVPLVARETATAAYTSSTRALVRATGTWPTWAAQGEVLIDGIVHEVETRDSATQLTLDAANCPAADIASTTVYIYRTSYTLPDDFLSMESPEGEDQSYFEYVEPAEWLNLERQIGATGNSYFWTIIGDPNTYGRHALVVYPIPTTAATLDFIYRRAPRRARISGYKSAEYTGTIALSAGASAVTGTLTNFNTTGWDGSILRLSDDANPPSGLGGTNPYLEEIPISAVGSATAMTLAANATNAYSGAGFRVTDVLDMSPTMYQAFLRRAELELLILSRADGKAIDQARGMYAEELIRALENDQRHPLDRSGISWPDEVQGDAFDLLTNISISTITA